MWWVTECLSNNMCKPMWWVTECLSNNITSTSMYVSQHCLSLSILCDVQYIFTKHHHMCNMFIQTMLLNTWQHVTAKQCNICYGNIWVVIWASRLSINYVDKSDLQTVPPYLRFAHHLTENLFTAWLTLHLWSDISIATNNTPNSVQLIHYSYIWLTQYSPLYSAYTKLLNSTTWLTNYYMYLTHPLLTTWFTSFTT